MRTIQLFSALSLLLSAAFLCSCNSDQSTSREIALSSVKIMGEDNQYIEVVSGTYTLNFEKDGNNYNTSITLNLRLVKEVGELQGKEAKYGNIAVALLDNEGQRVDIDKLWPKDGGWDKIEELLKSDVGSEIKVKFKSDWGVDGEKRIEFDKITNIELVDADFGEVSTTSYSSSDSDSSSSDDSDDWDAVIDDYEDFIDQYIALLKKAKAGDADALTEYTSMLSKVQDLQTKLTNAQSNLSPTQAARFSKMMTKMASAASTM